MFQRMPVTKRLITIIILGAAGIITGIVVALQLGTQPAPADFDWHTDWAVERGFNITIDSGGFQFPTSIAFIPEPGDSPKDPLYFVTELGGQIKVVTNDRTVFTFAEDFFNLRPRERIVPVLGEEVGMAGICLAPEQGQVFVTFSYHDANNTLRNNVVRFQSIPRRFSLSPTSQVDFTEIFDQYPSSRSHQIGPCEVRDDQLYVSVADGGLRDRSQLLDSVLGKVLRMDLDGKLASGNLFKEDENIENARNYVWASGLRNPFGLKLVGDRVFVADNGPDVDRFIQIKKGANYLWDGSNASIGTNADAVFYPGRGVAQMDYYPSSSELFPERFKGNFLMTMSGNPVERRDGFPAIWTVPYEMSQERLSGVASPLLRFRGNQVQVVAALGLGPDGLYFAPLLPNRAGFNGVFKISFDPEKQYPFVLEEESNPLLLMNSHGCFACHSLNENRRGTIGPILDRELLAPRLESRLNSPEYSLRIKEVDELEDEPFVSYRAARRSVEQAVGSEKISTWLYYRILEPRFDDPNAVMPQLGLSSQQARVLADFLARTPSGTADADTSRSPLGKISDGFNKVADAVQDRLPVPTHSNAKKYLAAFFGVGVGIGAVATALTLGFLIRRRRKRNDGMS